MIATPINTMRAGGRLRLAVPNSSPMLKSVPSGVAAGDVGPPGGTLAVGEVEEGPVSLGI
jgi:hypothetical protein